MGDVVRKYQLEVMSNLKGKNLIKVITGVRRSGKSTLMQQFQELLKKDEPNASIISIHLDIPEFRFLAEKNWMDLYTFIKYSLNPDTVNYIFLDEIQNVPEFEKLLEGLYVHPNIDLYVTGSNAYLLSSELATLLTGRAFEIKMFPFSFAEYLEFTGKTDNLDRAFESYLDTGGFPEAVRLSLINRIYSYEYLQTVFKNIYENDILTRHKINATDSYQEVVHFLADSIGSIVSPTNIAKTLTNKGKKTDSKTVAKYIDTLVESYLFYKVNRYDIKGKQQLVTLEKYYLVDTGFRNALLGKELNSDKGHLLENVIYVELLRRGNQVWIGKAENKEVDFVVRDEKGFTKYIQVAQSVKSPETLSRELAPFELIKDHSEKILITMDFENGSRNGIKQINAIDWLLGKQI